MSGRGRRRRRRTTHSGCSRHAASWPARSCTFCRHVDKQNNTTPPKPHTVSLYTTTHARRSAAKKKRTRARATRRRHIPSSPCFSNSSGCLVIRKVGPSAGPPRRQLTNRAAIPRCFHRGNARRGRRAAHIQHSGIGHRRTARRTTRTAGMVSSSRSLSFLGSRPSSSFTVVVSSVCRY